MAAEWRNEDEYFADREERLLRDAGREHGLSRRRLLQLAAAGLPVLAGLGRVAVPAPAHAARVRQAAPTGPIVKPLPASQFDLLGTNAEMRWDAAGGLPYAIPNERFFVRDHTATPLIDAASWRLSVFGTGLTGQPGPDRAIQLSLDELRALPSRTQTAFIECAGNGRSYFSSQQGTPAAGSQWHLGAVGVAVWKGVPLSTVLERAGVAKTAVDVLPQGLDANVVTNGVDQGKVRRPLPIAKALDDVLIAYEMNGVPLPPDHGFPARLVVPGWIGVASIKWLGQIEVADTTLYSPWTTTQYRLTGPTYSADEPPLTRQVVKSAFAGLPAGAQLAKGEPVVLEGRSWSGNGAIKAVDLSFDGGTTWRPARLGRQNVPDAWVQWTYPWTPRLATHYDLRARATDTTGVTQPATVPFNDGGYVFGAVVRHPITVVAA
jgi:DMSO/TMAO reductase YedYZ molybdopterin-dependent catalytic subunit